MRIRPTARQKIIILGGGPNRIGQGIEFDYCCVHAAYALKEAGFETIMVNCNPETVSTDYDTSDRLYFEPLTAEDVIALIRNEQEAARCSACIVQFGGQTPLKLSQALQKAGIPILGTSCGGHRHGRGSRALPATCCAAWVCASRRTASRARWTRRGTWPRSIGYPVVVRPSYVLGGRAMEIVYNDERAAPLRAPKP